MTDVKSPLVTRLDVPPDPAKVAEVREFVRHQLTLWGLYGLAEVGVQLAGELAANAVLHAGTPYAVVIERTLPGVQLDVLDHSPQPVAVLPADPEAERGRGLRVLQALASDWGATPEPDLKGFTKGVRVAVSE